MTKTLIQALSTGRTGTNFLSQAFVDQGYNAYHENVYVGEPIAAVHAYTNYLGDLWKQDPQAYYQLRDNFSGPFVRSVLNEMRVVPARRPWEQRKNWLANRLHHMRLKRTNEVLINLGNHMSLAPPLIDRSLAEVGVYIKYIILFRNPLRTIHALYKVEEEHAYRHRPQRFFTGNGYMAAAQIWKHYYACFLDLRDKLGAERFALLELEAFNADATHREGIFDFLGLALDSARLERFIEGTMRAPIRQSKTPSVRNSDLYKDLDFSFDDQQMDEIAQAIEPVASQLGIDLAKSLIEYRTFHREEKQSLMSA